MAHKILEEIIGKNIARYREAAGLTQATLAEKIGISTAFVSRVERGQKKMKVEILKRNPKATVLDSNAKKQKNLEWIDRLEDFDAFMSD